MSGSIPDNIAIDIEAMVKMYEENLEEFGRLADGMYSLFSSRKLRPLIHSIKVRVKDSTHLKDKLERKYLEATAVNLAFDISASNLYERITDLVGLRILHLHTQQFGAIHKVILDLLADELYEVVEGPSARYWDNEYRAYFESLGVNVEANPRLYTSVHYVIKPSRLNSRRGEIQVRTLAEELWGEVDHSLNYPHKVDDVAIREQLLVLARVTSSCTRLVDAIFKCDTHNKRLEHERKTS